MSTTNLKERIMRRIYAIWFVRRALPLSLGATFGIFVAYRATANSFFVERIVDNFFTVAAENIAATPNFVFAALLHADARAVSIVALSMIAGVFLASKLFSDIRVMLQARTAPLDFHRSN